jgi:outer membrane protein OmpA-like peptidoglycan-associated protein
MNSIIQGAKIDYYASPADYPNFVTEPIYLEQYFGLSLYPFLSIGISPYFDIGVSLPVYVDAMELNTENNGNRPCFNAGICKEGKFAGGQGDLRLMAKLRAPFPDEILVDLAFIGGITINTGHTNAYGLWVRDMSYININDKDNRLIWNGDQASTYTNGLNLLNVGLAATFDFNKIRAQVPLRWHLNYSYRMTLGEKVNEKDIKAEYPKVQTFSTAMEWTPSHFISLFGEYYRDMPTKSPAMVEGDFGLSTITLGTSLHFTESFDFQIGIQMLVPGSQDEHYIKDLNHEIGRYNATLMPKIMPFIGLNGKLFSKEPEEEEYRNPDTDGDGICDPWVSETGRQNEFTRVCAGIDLCPYEKGKESNNGCPLKKEAYRNPDTDGDGVCDPWVSEEGREGEFSNCTGIDLCPYEAGTKENSGCPVVESVSAEPTIMFSASPGSVQAGKSATLSWITTDAEEVEIDNNVGKVQPRGTKKVSPTETTTYTITVKGKGGTKSETVDVVIEAASAPTAVFSAAPEVIQKGQSVTLTWMTTNATEVSIEGVGVVPAKGTKKLSPAENTTYTIVVKGEGGQTIETVDVRVEEPKIEAKVNLKGVNFLSGKAELTLVARRVLDGVVEQLLAAPTVKIEIHGHTDNVGKPASNQDLSERRAKAVAGYLASKGVKAGRMKAVGFGQDSPIADNSTASGRELNRRIEMIRVDE